MSALGKITILLPPELEAFVEAGISSGKYGSAEMLIQQGVRLLLERHLEREEQLKVVREKLEVGRLEIERGEYFDGPTVVREILERLERTIAESKAAG